MKDKKYKKSELSKTMKKFIKTKEKSLTRTCRTIWSFTNPLGQQFLFGSFCKNRKNVIVTLGHFIFPCGFITTKG